MSGKRENHHKHFFSELISRLKKQILKGSTPENLQPIEEAPWENPYIPYSRAVIEQILTQRNLDYRAFRPTVIDTDSPDQIFGEEDDVDQVLAQLEQGLNFLEICTGRPDHFSDWKNHMEEEYGLIVRIVGKSWEYPLYGNMVLDFERHQPMRLSCFAENVIYLPFQKVKWIAGAGGNPAENKSVAGAEMERESDDKSEADFLDINVPIGYNRIIVKVEEPCTF
ncbi:MAG: hypothetical protein LUF32_04445 [Clostridiales bacterium]|nr:hypothetical protein [Clostridiales bacterium]